MSIYLGTDKVKNLWLGTDKVKNIWLGTDKIYSQSLAYTWNVYEATQYDSNQMNITAPNTRFKVKDGITKLTFANNVYYSSDVNDWICAQSSAGSTYTIPTSAGTYQLPITSSHPYILGTNLRTVTTGCRYAYDYSFYSYIPTIKVDSDGSRYIYNCRLFYFYYSNSGTFVKTVSSDDPNAYPDNNYEYDSVADRVYWFVKQS